MFTARETLEFDAGSLSALVFQTAACVIAICDTRKTELVPSGIDPVKHALTRFVDWKDGDYVRALQAQVSLVYDFVKMALDNRAYFMYVGEGEVALITQALADYQRWKTEYITHEKRRRGAGYEMWGDDSEFNQKDWSRLNQQFANAFAGL